MKGNMGNMMKQMQQMQKKMMKAQEELLAKITTDEEEDELLPAAIDFVLEANQASTSLLQRHFRIGYNRAARLIDTLEHRGIINQQNGSKPREVLITKSQLNEMLQ